MEIPQHESQGTTHTGTIKIHKQHNPIRPIVNWRDSPAYKLAKYITMKLKETVQLPNTYNVKTPSTSS
jgi:sugar (pentulose or hexulose) kinase